MGYIFNEETGQHDYDPNDWGIPTGIATAGLMDEALQKKQRENQEEQAKAVDRASATASGTAGGVGLQVLQPSASANATAQGAGVPVNPPGLTNESGAYAGYATALPPDVRERIRTGNAREEDINQPGMVPAERLQILAPGQLPFVPLPMSGSLAVNLAGLAGSILPGKVAEGLGASPEVQNYANIAGGLVAGGGAAALEGRIHPTVAHITPEEIRARGVPERWDPEGIETLRQGKADGIYNFPAEATPAIQKQALSMVGANTEGEPAAVADRYNALRYLMDEKQNPADMARAESYLKFSTAYENRVAGSAAPGGRTSYAEADAFGGNGAPAEEAGSRAFKPQASMDENGNIIPAREAATPQEPAPAADVPLRNDVAAPAGEPAGAGPESQRLLTEGERPLALPPGGQPIDYNPGAPDVVRAGQDLAAEYSQTGFSPPITPDNLPSIIRDAIERTPTGPSASTAAMIQKLDDALASTLANDLKTSVETASPENRATAAQGAQERAATVKAWVGAENAKNAVQSSPTGVAHLMEDIKNSVGGTPGDSYVTQLLHQKNDMVNYLTGRGMDEGMAERTAQNVVDRQLASRYDGNPPAALTKQMNDALNGKPNAVLGAMGDLMQRAKNTIFPFDLGVFGQQGLTAVHNGGLQALEGLVNRTLSTLHLPGARQLYIGADLERAAQRVIDGGGYYAKGGEASGIVKPGSGTLLSYVPKVGPVLDRALDRFVIEPTNKFQFNTVMGTVRDLIYEGNLLNAKAIGRDITNPSVRASAMENANQIASKAHGAMSPNRQAIETATLLSSSMTRSQFGRINEMTRLLRPSAAPDERLNAAMMIASRGITILLAGKFLNDMVGIKPFSFDPTDPKHGKDFGKITIPTGDLRKDVTIQLFPQRSLEKAFTDSIAAIRAEDPSKVEEAWAKFATGRESVLASTAAKYTPGIETGYDNNGRFYMGNYPQKSVADSALDTAKSVAPSMSQTFMQGGLTTKENAAANVFGLNAYEVKPSDENQMSFRERAQKSGIGTLELAHIQDKVSPYFDVRQRIQDNAFKQAQEQHPELKPFNDAYAFRSYLETPEAKGGLGMLPEAAGRYGNEILRQYTRDWQRPAAAWLLDHPDLMGLLQKASYSLPSQALERTR